MLLLETNGWDIVLKLLDHLSDSKVQGRLFSIILIVIIVLIMIQITTKFKPWTWILKKLSAIVTEDLKKSQDEILKNYNEKMLEQRQLSDTRYEELTEKTTEAISTSNSLAEYVVKRFDELEFKQECMDNNRRRTGICRYASEIGKVYHSIEYSNNMRGECEIYRDFCNKHKDGYINDVANDSMKAISEEYKSLCKISDASIADRPRHFFRRRG